MRGGTDDGMASGMAADGDEDAPKFMDEDGGEIINATSANQVDRRKIIGDRYHDRGKIPDEFNKIEVGLRIMPS